jgi:hypothetical protein
MGLLGRLQADVLAWRWLCEGFELPVSGLRRDFSALRRLGVLEIFLGDRLVAAIVSVGGGRQGQDSGGSGSASDFTACLIVFVFISLSISVRSLSCE